MSRTPLARSLAAAAALLASSATFAAPPFPPAPPGRSAASPAGSPAPIDRIVIRAARLLDGRGKALAGVTVVVAGSRIVSVQSAAAGAAAPDPPAGACDLARPDAAARRYRHSRPHRLALRRRRPVACRSRRRRAGRAERVSTRPRMPWRTVRGGITTVQSLGAAEDRELREALARGVIPGPRLLTSLTPIDDETGPPRRDPRRGATSWRPRAPTWSRSSPRRASATAAAPTLSQEQLDAACGEARAHGLRSAVHAHGIESVRRAVAAGCGSIEHGVLLDAATLRLMAEHGTYFDPNLDLVFRNYFENQAHFLGIGNYTAEGFAQMRQAVPRALAVFRQALATPGLKMVFGTDAVAGAHGRNFEELDLPGRARRPGADGGDRLGDLAGRQSLGLGDRTGSHRPRLRGRPHRRRRRSARRTSGRLRAGGLGDEGRPGGQERGPLPLDARPAAAAAGSPLRRSRHIREMGARLAHRLPRSPSRERRPR